MPNPVQMTVPPKSTGTAYLWWAFFGQFGAHKFYLGRPWLGVLWACTFGFFIIGTIWDLFTIPAQVRRANRRLMADAKDRSAPGPKTSRLSADAEDDDGDRFAGINFDRYRTPRSLPPAPPTFGRRGVR